MNRVQKLISYLNTSGSGEISFQEFMQRLAQSSPFYKGNVCETKAQTRFKGENAIQHALVRDRIRGHFQDAQQVLVSPAFLSKEY